MWMLILMMTVNAVLHQYKVQNVYRIELGIVQIGIVDILLAVGFLYALLRGGSARSRFPTPRIHPVLLWIVVPMAFGAVFGVIGGLAGGSHMKWFLSSLREYVAFPVCVFIGYRLIGTPQNVRTGAIWTIVAGVLTATMLFVDFGGNTEKASLTGSLNPVRGIVVNWYGEYAAVIGLVMIYVVMTRFPLWRTSIHVPLGLWCYIGYAITLSRLGFVILFFGTASTYLLLPKGERIRKFMRSIVFIPVLFFACWGSLWLSDRIIGRDFGGKVLKHIESLLPVEREGSKDTRAWDSRIGGIVSELGIWLRNPLIGQGFGVGETAQMTGRTLWGDSIKHNGWTANLAESGVVGTTGLAVLMGSLLLLGYRMAHDRTDHISMLMGAVGFFTGVVFFFRFTGTLVMSSRTAIGVGLVAGMLIRAREIQQAQLAMAQEQQWYENYYVDEETGLLDPQYAETSAHF